MADGTEHTKATSAPDAAAGDGDRESSFEKRRAKTDRARSRVAAQFGEGDVLMVTPLDRLARSTRDLLSTLATITGKGARFRSLHMTDGPTPRRRTDA
jgi:DNA invertase Pin-like site-specific DNA recombinase